jgi:hypothetical protein
VYATEFGYGYAGEEYWQTFQAETPNWSGERDWLRDLQRHRTFTMPTRHRMWAVTGSNRRPLRCKRSALPLS